MSTKKADGVLVMLIEDNDDVRDSLEELLTDEGFDVIGAESGQDALTKLQSATRLPRVLLVDLMMPLMNGPEFLDELKKHERYEDIDVVLLSADPAIATKAEALGVTTYVRKPVHLDELLDVLARVV